MVDIMDYGRHTPFNAREGQFLDSLPASTDNLTVGQSTIPRESVCLSTVTVTTGNLRIKYFTATKSETITQVRTCTGGTAMITPTLCRVGLYTVAANGDLTLVASTANDVTLWLAASSRYTTAFTAPYTLVRGARYAVGILCVATTTPTMLGNNVMLGGENAELPRITANVPSLADLPSTIADGTLASIATGIYSVLLP